MTTATAARTGEETVSEARAVLDRALKYPWPEDHREAGKAIRDLTVALKEYRDLRFGIVAPCMTWLSGLEPGPESLAGALRSAATTAWEKAGDVEALLEHCGEEAAAIVSGDKGGEQ